MRSTRLYCACVLVMLMAGKTHAGWMFEPYLRVFETFRNPANLLALGTLQDVRQLSHEEVKDRFGGTWWPDRPCFGLRVNVVEVLRGVPTAESLEVPFAIIDVPEFPLGQGTDQQRETCLTGRKALVLVNRTPESKEPSFSVWTVTSFEADEQVQFWRKVAALWNMPDVPDRRQVLLAGCRDSLPAFQDYCCNRLAIWDGGKPDDNAAEQLDRAAALPVIWGRFVDPKTPLDVLVTCDEILGEKALRSGQAFLGWRTHPARYDVMERAPPAQRVESPAAFQLLPSLRTQCVGGCAHRVVSLSRPNSADVPPVPGRHRHEHGQLLAADFEAPAASVSASQRRF